MPRNESGRGEQSKKSSRTSSKEKPSAAGGKKALRKKTTRSSRRSRKTWENPVGRAKEAAERLLRNPDQLRRLAYESADKVQTTRARRLRQIIEEVRALIRLTYAYARGEYRAIPMDSMVLIVAGACLPRHASRSRPRFSSGGTGR